MTPDPVISVVLPVYNGEKYLSESISSVLSQTFTNFELIILNDGSTDSTEAIVESFSDSRIRYIKNDTNLGLIKTLNRGVSLARGRYIARMDADDRCSADRFFEQHHFLENNSDYVLCGSWVKTIDAEGIITGRIKRIEESELIRTNMLFTTPFIHPTVMIRSNLLKSNPYSESAVHCEDLELWPRLAAKQDYKFFNIKKYLLDYRIHDQNISVVNLDFQNRNKLRVLRPFVESLLQRPMTEQEQNIHLLSYKTGQLVISPEVMRLSERWFEYLSESNKKIQLFNQDDLDALLLSRWFVLCIRSGKYHKMPMVHVPWYKPGVLFKSIKLLLYK
jgi:glycosyltransferase involved in cell wall biosynthesis